MGRTFGEIDLLFDNHVPARKFKYTAVDQFSQSNVVDEKEGYNATHVEGA